MNRIGFIYNYREGTLPTRAYLAHRAVPMARVLRESGVELFMFSPRHLDPDTGRVPGYLVEPDGFAPAESTVPPVNGSWYVGTSRAICRSGLSMARFHKWAATRGIDVYPDQPFTRLVKDKLRTFRLLEEIDPALHPHTESFRGSENQVLRFLDRCRTVFIKPRRGNQGNKILVLRHDEPGLHVTHYDNKERLTTYFSTIAAAMENVTRLTQAEPFVIQEGLDVEREDGASFIVRVIMVHDGRTWNWLHKAVVAPDGGDVANTTQGGSNHTLDELFGRLYRPADARCLIEDLRRVSFDVTEHLDETHRGRLMEIAFDFILSTDGRVQMVEVNTQPGMAKPGLTGDQPFADIFNLSPEEQVLHDRLVMPHATWLAQFLLSRLEQRTTSSGLRRA